MEDKVKFELRGLPIPNFLYKENKLSVITLKVYCFIHAYTNPFYFSNDHLAEMFDCHPDTISTSINQLEKYGYIKTKYARKAGGGKIRLCLDTDLQSVYTPSGSQKSEPTTLSGHPDKESKEDFLKGEIFSDEKIPAPKTFDTTSNDYILRRRKERHANKGKGLSSFTGYNNTPQPNIIALGKIDLWKIAKELRVPPPSVYTLHTEIMERVNDGSFNEKWGHSMDFVLKNWVRNGIRRGEIETLDLMGMLVLEDDHPDKVARRQEIVEELQEKGIL